MQTVNKGDKLPCGGVVCYVGPSAYQYRDSRGKRHTVELDVPRPAIDWAAVRAAAAAEDAAREAYANRDMTAENAAAEESKRQFTAEVSRILAIAGVSTRDELMGSIPWASGYLPKQLPSGDLVAYDQTGETRGIWDKQAKAWTWAWQNNRGNLDDVGSGYGRHAD